ncbi:hypothetical protein L3Y34_001929 [Caenorhabditis briggsae]|uniref:Uncharacterized protein n=2 Tax=Caenorhabditis briggsae TaxID=6238 RepID=A0AAE9IQS6_CAEBR|nr:hypothetical protein L3Y34_001929 [Caenorhabditis briggsae]
MNNSKIRPNIFVKSTGISLNMQNGSPIVRPTVQSSNGQEKKLFIVRGNTRLPAFLAAGPSIRRSLPANIDIGRPLPAKIEVEEATSPPQQLMEKEIKEEPIDEEVETCGAIANITESKPINLEDFMCPPVISQQSSSRMREDDLKQEPLVLHLKTDASKVSPSQLPLPHNFKKETRPYRKRNRKPTRNDDFIYENPESAEENIEDTPEPSSKSSKSAQGDGCRCEYIVPELDSKMDRIMDKMHFIETLARSMLAKEQTNAMEKSFSNSALVKAQNEIQLLRRQLIIQRNTGAVPRLDNNF